jgi:uncharacterized protein YlxW (UPF0749 family)
MTLEDGINMRFRNVSFKKPYATSNPENERIKEIMKEAKKERKRERKKGNTISNEVKKLTK